MNSYIDVCDYNSPYHYDSPSLHWCFHCPSSTKWVSTSFLPPPHPYHQQFSTAPPPPSPTFPPAALEKMYTSIQTVQNLVIELQESNSCMLSNFIYIGSVLQEMQLDLTTLAETITEEATVDDELDNIALVSVNESDFDLVDETSTALDPQSILDKVGDTLPELEGFKVLPVAPIITYFEVEFDSGCPNCFREPDLGIISFNSRMEFCIHFERPRVAYNLFDQMPKSNRLYRYGMMPKNVTAQYMLLHFLFDPGSANGLIFEGVALVFTNSLLWIVCLVRYCQLSWEIEQELLQTKCLMEIPKETTLSVFSPFANEESILIPLSYHDYRIPSEIEPLSRYAAFLHSILNLGYGHQFAMYHYRLLDTMLTPSLMTLPEAVQSWLKFLDNEPAPVGIFVAALALAVEPRQPNLMDQILDERPPYCTKVFDLRLSAATIILAAMELYLEYRHSEADRLFDECPQLVESEILGSAIVFQVNFTKQFVCDGNWRDKVQVARFTQLQVKLSPFNFSEIFASVEPIIPHLLEITSLWIHACN